MTMYLSNSDVGPTGYEAGEFIEPPIVTPPAEPIAIRQEADADDGEPRPR